MPRQTTSWVEPACWLDQEVLGRICLEHSPAMGQRLIITDNRDKPGRPLLLNGEVIDAASTAARVRIKGAHREVLPAVFHKKVEQIPHGLHHPKGALP